MLTDRKFKWLSGYYTKKVQQQNWNTTDSCLIVCNWYTETNRIPHSSANLSVWQYWL